MTKPFSDVGNQAESARLLFLGCEFNDVAQCKAADAVGITNVVDNSKALRIAAMTRSYAAAEYLLLESKGMNTAQRDFAATPDYFAAEALIKKDITLSELWEKHNQKADEAYEAGLGGRLDEESAPTHASPAAPQQKSFWSRFIPGWK